jgi:hypothetical protein
MPTTHQRRFAPARPDNHLIGKAGKARQAIAEPIRVWLCMAGVAMSGTARTSKPSNRTAGFDGLGCVPQAKARQGRLCWAMNGQAAHAEARYDKAGEALHGRAQQAEVSPGRQRRAMSGMPLSNQARQAMHGIAQLGSARPSVDWKSTNRGRRAGYKWPAPF